MLGSLTLRESYTEPAGHLSPEAALIYESYRELKAIHENTCRKIERK